MKNNKIRRNPKVMSFNDLVYEIESLDQDGIISFEEFKNIPLMNIKGDYFPMANYRTIEKAIIKIEDERSGQKAPSSYTSITEIHKEGKIIIKKRIDYF